MRRWNIPAAAAEAGWGTCSGTAAGSGRRTAAALRRAPLAQTVEPWAARTARWDTAAAFDILKPFGELVLFLLTLKSDSLLSLTCSCCCDVRGVFFIAVLDDSGDFDDVEHVDDLGNGQELKDLCSFSISI